jgi:hypothetical protein
VLIAWAAVAAASLLSGPKVFDSMSMDDLMRLIQVRDWLAGQGWFDLVQHRLDPPAGVAMHWSRLVDLPIAALILALNPVLGRVGAEFATAALWPPMLLLPALALVGLLARQLAGSTAALAAVLLTAVAAPVLVHFRPGALDHHGLQLVLVLAATFGASARDARTSALGGLAAAGSLAIGLEMLPAIAAILAAVGLRWAIEGERAARATASFGLTFGIATTALLAATVPLSGWSDTACDAISAPWIAVAGLSGGGLALLARASRQLAGIKARLAFGGFAGLAAAALVAMVFSHCLRDPFAETDPQVAALWLAHVSELQNAREVLRNTPAEFLPIYGPLVLALILGGMAAMRAWAEERTWFFAPLFALAALTAVAALEVRGASSANLIAQPLLAAALFRLWSAKARAWLLAILFAISSPALVLAGQGVGALVKLIDPNRPVYMVDGPGACRRFDDVAPLKRIERGLVLSFVDIGSAILVATDHSILAAPYHRNLVGNKTAIDVLTGDAKNAERKLKARGIDYVAICPGSPERINFERAAPDGLAARLARGEVPAYLERVPGDPSEPLRVFRVKR